MKQVAKSNLTFRRVKVTFMTVPAHIFRQVKMNQMKQDAKSNYTFRKGGYSRQYNQTYFRTGKNEAELRETGEIEVGYC